MGLENSMQRHSYQRKVFLKFLYIPLAIFLLSIEDYNRGQQFLEHEIDKALSPTLKSYLEEVF